MKPDEFDRVFAPNRASRPRIIWTAAGIGRVIGASADFVRGTLAHLPGSPVRKVGTRWMAYEADLLEFMRGGGRGD
jgi:hypothetical protein